MTILFSLLHSKVLACLWQSFSFTQQGVSLFVMIFFLLHSKVLACLHLTEWNFFEKQTPSRPQQNITYN